MLKKYYLKRSKKKEKNYKNKEKVIKHFFIKKLIMVLLL
jgi:hypothetical protein